MAKEDIVVIGILLMIAAFFGAVGYQIGLVKHYEPLKECQLNATYYEERIWSYKFEIEVLSSEIYVCHKEFNDLFNFCEDCAYPDTENWELVCADNCTITESLLLD